jgi:hypothetical protein
MGRKRGIKRSRLGSRVSARYVLPLPHYGHLTHSLITPRLRIDLDSCSSAICLIVLAPTMPLLKTLDGSLMASLPLLITSLISALISSLWPSPTSVSWA